MPNIKDYVDGYGEQNPGYDGPYLKGHDFDPAVSFNDPNPVELKEGELAFNSKGQAIVTEGTVLESAPVKTDFNTVDKNTVTEDNVHSITTEVDEPVKSEEELQAEIDALNAEFESPKDGDETSKDSE